MRTYCCSQLSSFQTNYLLKYEQKLYQAPQIMVVDIQCEGLIACSGIQVEESHADDGFVELSQKSEGIWDE